MRRICGGNYLTTLIQISQEGRRSYAGIVQILRSRPEAVRQIPSELKSGVDRARQASTLCQNHSSQFSQGDLYPQTFQWTLPMLRHNGLQSVLYRRLKSYAVRNQSLQPLIGSGLVKLLQ